MMYVVCRCSPAVKRELVKLEKEVRKDARLACQRKECLREITFIYYYIYLKDAFLQSDMQFRKQAQPVPAVTGVKGVTQEPDAEITLCFQDKETEPIYIYFVFMYILYSLYEKLKLYIHVQECVHFI